MKDDDSDVLRRACEARKLAEYRAGVRAGGIDAPFKPLEINPSLAAEIELQAQRLLIEGRTISEHLSDVLSQSCADPEKESHVRRRDKEMMTLLANNFTGSDMALAPDEGNVIDFAAARAERFAGEDVPPDHSPTVA